MKIPLVSFLHDINVVVIAAFEFLCSFIVSDFEL